MTRHSRRELLQWTGGSLAGSSLLGAASQSALAASGQVSVDQNIGGTVELPQKEGVVISGTTELDRPLVIVINGQSFSRVRDQLTTDPQFGSDWSVTLDLTSPGAAAFDDLEIEAGTRTICTLNAKLVDPPYLDDAALSFENKTRRNYVEESVDEATVAINELKYGGYVHIEDADGNVLGRTEDRITRTDGRIDQDNPSAIDIEFYGGVSVDTPATLTAVATFDEAGDDPYLSLDEGRVIASAQYAAPALFEVVQSAPDSTSGIEGTEFTVTATVRNIGELEQPRELQFRTTDGSVSKSKELSIPPGQQETVEFTFGSGLTDGTYQYELLQEDDDEILASNSITVQPAPVYDVTIENVNTPVEGRTLDVTVQIENTDDRSDTQPIRLTVADFAERSRSVSLSGGESTTELFSIPVEDGDAGEYDISVTTMNDTNSDNTTVTVFDQTPFLIDIQGVNEPVAGDDPIEVTATITNGGATSDTQTITLAVPDIETTSTEVSLGPGESTTEQFSLATGDEDAGTYSVTVESAEDSASQEVTVSEPVTFDVEISEAPDSVVAGEFIEIQVAVTNSGDVPGTQQVVLNIFDFGRDSRDVEIAAGGTTTRTFRFETERGAAGEYTAMAESGDDTASVEFRILKPPTFDVEAIESTRPVAGNDLEIDVTVVNSGDVSGGTAVTATVSEDDSPASEFGSSSKETANIGAGGDTEMSFVFPTGEVDDGEYTVTVTTDDAEATDTVTVASPAFRLSDGDDLLFLGSAGLGATLSYVYARLLNRSG